MYASLKSREIAQSFGFTRFKTLVKVSILKIMPLLQIPVERSHLFETKKKKVL